MIAPHQALPSLNALRAFETAARHLSFKDAAAELNVSASAIGHQITDLEAYLGTALFIRKHRQILLTPDGMALLPGLQGAFDQLRGTIRAFHNARQERPLILSVEPTFALHCLIPRLEPFRAQNPDITVRVEPNHEITDPRIDDVDICIRYGDGNYPGLQVDTIANHEEIIAVCSPDLLNGKYPLREPIDICHHSLIDRPDNAYYYNRADWTRWFQAAGMDDVVCKGRLEVSYESYAIVSAIQGQGLTLVNKMMIEDDLKAGRLIQPFDISYQVNTGYYLLIDPLQSGDLRIKAFRDWVLSQH
jgi:LysR family transcriptional regulator, glycine cleavage system transcriptional activator